MPTTVAKKKKPRTSPKLNHAPTESGVCIGTDFGELLIPHTVCDLSSFRKWSYTEPLLEKVKVSFFDGQIMVENEMEKLFNHAVVKSEIIIELSLLVRAASSGYLLQDGMRFASTEAKYSTEPDGMFVSYDSIKSGRVRLTPTSDGDDVIEVEGSADMVLEVVSPRSRNKDTVRLMDYYYRAGVTEYWLVDCSGDQVSFDIYRRGASAFEATRKQNGWLKSAVYSKSFRLTRGKDPIGNPRVELHVQ